MSHTRYWKRKRDGKSEVLSLMGVDPRRKKGKTCLVLGRRGYVQILFEIRISRRACYAKVYFTGVESSAGLLNGPDWEWIAERIKEEQRWTQTRVVKSDGQIALQAASRR